jgi:trehalose utilization protein
MARVTVWNEYRHERENDAVADVYPDGIHAVLADALREAGHEVRTATLH